MKKFEISPSLVELAKIRQDQIEGRLSAVEGEAYKARFSRALADNPDLSESLLEEILGGVLDGLSGRTATFYPT